MAGDHRYPTSFSTPVASLGQLQRFSVTSFDNFFSLYILFSTYFLLIPNVFFGGVRGYQEVYPSTDCGAFDCLALSTGSHFLL
jgi:hypothetical protein